MLEESWTRENSRVGQREGTLTGHWTVVSMDTSRIILVFQNQYGLLCILTEGQPWFGERGDGIGAALCGNGGLDCEIDGTWL